MLYNRLEAQFLSLQVETLNSRKSGKESIPEVYSETPEYFANVVYQGYQPYGTSVYWALQLHPMVSPLNGFLD